jgi:hypothetical protein
VNTRLATLATILIVATGCDKAKAFVRSGQGAEPPRVAPGEALDLSANPSILFQVFGESNDPRMIPIATIRNGELRSIQLSQQGWHQFDATYLRQGRTYTLFQDGHASGRVEVRQGMWEHEPLYSLPSCQTLTPLSAVHVTEGHVRGDFTVEFLASNVPLGVARAAPALSTQEIARIARDVAAGVASEVGITRKTLDSLDFHALAFHSGATKAPTIVASFIDPAAESPKTYAARTAHVVVIADKDASGAYRATYAHRMNGPLADAIFRRYFDHLDLTGDGVDEIVLEGWKFGGDTYLSVLGWHDGRWTETFRTRPNWCLDQRPPT